ncbi:MAG: hypothetical protein GX046_04325 [Tissierellia bacterium]|nr:hypothetical protein [Tissierellia bacterium]
MIGIYKTSKDLFLLEFTSYWKINWKSIFGNKDKIAPQFIFEKKGILLIYDLKDCRIEKDRIIYKGKEVQLLNVTK